MFSKLNFKRVCLCIAGSGILAFGLYNIHALSGVTEGGILGMTLLLHHLFHLFSRNLRIYHERYLLYHWMASAGSFFCDLFYSVRMLFFCILWDF